MTVAIAVNENHAKALVDPHFGRCNWYCLVETDSMKLSFIENPGIQLQQAGAEAAQFHVEKKVDMVIAGRFGCKSWEIFREHNIQMVIPELPQSLNEILDKIK